MQRQENYLKNYKVGEFRFKGSSSSYESTDSIDFESKRKYKFLNLNRRLKPHRVILLSFLENEGLIKNNLVSYDIDLLYCKEVINTISS